MPGDQTVLKKAILSRSDHVRCDIDHGLKTVQQFSNLSFYPGHLVCLFTGTRTTLQPVAVGVNGEIGYIAIQEGPVVMSTSVATTDMTMQHLHQSTLVSPVHLALGAPGTIATDAALDPQTTG